MIEHRLGAWAPGKTMRGVAILDVYVSLGFDGRRVPHFDGD
jgi:hypothetical protein